MVPIRVAYVDGDSGTRGKQYECAHVSCQTRTEFSHMIGAYDTFRVFLNALCSDFVAPERRCRIDGTFT